MRTSHESKAALRSGAGASVQLRTPAESSSRRYAFADLELDVGVRQLLRRGEPIALPKLSFDFLRVLVEAAPNLVTHEALAREVWGPRRVVTQENLNQRLLMLRQSLGDSATRPRYVESVRGQGCRLIVGVTALPPRDADGRTRRVPIISAATARWLGVLCALAIATVVSTGVLSWREGTPDSSVAAGSVANGRRAGPPAKLPDSVAVLPFEQLNAEPDPGFFSDALHAEIINALGSNSDLNVIGRASVLHYRDSRLPVSEIARELGVEAIATGTIRYTADRIRVTAELVDAESGIQLWASDYDTTFDELFTVRRDMTIGIANSLSVPISADDEARLASLRTSPEATAFYLRAMDVFGSDTLGSRQMAQTYLDQAIELDGNFAHAYAGKALIGVYSIINAGDVFDDPDATTAERVQSVRDYAATALALNPDTDLAYYALGVLDMFSWRWEQARDEFVHALEITPQHTRFLSQLAWLEVCALGDADGTRYAERAVILDPQNPVVYELLSSVLQCRGDDAQALAARQRALELDPTSYSNRLSRVFLTARTRSEEAALRELRNLEPLLTDERVLSMPAVALTYAGLGYEQDAARLFDRFARVARERRIGPANWYMAYLAVGDYDNAYRMLEKAVASPGPGPGFYTLMSFMRNPGTEPPFDEPRFLSLRDSLRARR